MFVGKQPSLNHIRVFGCAAYVLRQPEGSKFESRAIGGVHLETLQHGVYRILVTDDDGIPRITESRHVTFDESKFPGAPILEEYMDDEADSDDSYDPDSVDTESDIEDDVHLDIADDKDSSTNDVDNSIMTMITMMKMMNPSHLRRSRTPRTMMMMMMMTMTTTSRMRKVNLLQNHVVTPFAPTEGRNLLNGTRQCRLNLMTRLPSRRVMSPL